MVHFVDSLHECADTSQLWSLVSYLFGSVEHGIELAYFVGVSDPVKDDLKLILAPRHLEVIFSDTHLGEG